jgi:hypothetical protein
MLVERFHVHQHAKAIAVMPLFALQFAGPEIRR